MTRSGQDYLAGLKDGRCIFLDGKRVADVTTNDAFRNVAASMAKLFDFAHASGNQALMTFETPEGGSANRIWQLPTSLAELQERRKALEAWASIHAGFMGRAPDHVASCISGMFMGLDVFQAFDPQRAAALESYYRYARDRRSLPHLCDHQSAGGPLQECCRTAGPVPDGRPGG